jgi:hypothetical protein
VVGVLHPRGVVCTVHRGFGPHPGGGGAGRNLTRTEWTRYLPGEKYRRTCPDFGAGS